MTLFLSAEPEAGDLCSMLLTAFSLVLVLVTLPFSLCVSVKVSSLASFVLQLSVGLTIVYPKKFLDLVTNKVHEVPSMLAIHPTYFGRLCKSMSEPWCSDWDG